MLQEFSYQAPATQAELLQLLKERGNEVRLLAGGTDLLVDIRSGFHKPQTLVDLKKIPELRQLTFDAKTGLSIGAAVRCIDVMQNKIVREKYPLIANAASRIGSIQLRNRATLVGNLCTASPAADMAPGLLCLDASVEIASTTGTRTVKLSEFFTGVKRTVLDQSEVVTRILVPATTAGLKSGMEKLKRIKGHDLALASVCMVRRDTRLRVAIGACSVTPVLLPEFSVGDALSDIKEAAAKAIKPIDDVRASAKYRVFMVQTYIERLWNQIMKEETAKGGKAK
ncbi:MAG TPA: xanthine dehydrogenase family protein subunit M [Candidatus Ozemobacteraceae bacterium]|nr:xanthine dehydrogenase family protein subunit M [Candidatus Ozemobacteraceae bacterium]